ncbi:RidA family protein [Pseudomonas schmalbachii]|uniref:RidA family protein n=1 Tax=Pseudomonas schmalbachii TaxID=2816993 RepID=A0ABS3TTI8_9PSED|nr:RidA family protein [Pseudomonas schmalbachii]MBO3276948.1 RidA family protein [Pseudomonas schmalbachii]
MLKQRVYSPSVNEPADKLWSNAMTVGGFVFVSGMTARGADRETVLGENEYEQAKVVFQKIKDMVSAAGGVMNDIVKMTIFVTNIKNNTQVWKAREKFFSGDFPTCTLVEVSSLAKPEILLEIEAIGYVGCSGEKAA